MKPLYTQEQFIKAKTNDILSVECYTCEQPFNLPKKKIRIALNPKQQFQGKYCSTICKPQSKQNRKRISVNCLNCEKSFNKFPNQIEKSPNHFCSKSCAATYNNKNKTHGTRRSKLEIWLENQLPIIFPHLKFQFNQKSAINSELDIYIPSLSLAFELNGIFHYEPIYGSKKLDQIQANDISKYKACHDAKIDLCIIDTSNQKNFKLASSNKYLDIITKIINERALIYQ